eukprot:Gb_16200 [translate_table: standard]
MELCPRPAALHLVFANTDPSIVKLHWLSLSPLWPHL